MPLMKQPTNDIPGAGVGARENLKFNLDGESKDSNPIVATKDEQLEAIRASCGGFTKQP